MQRFDSIKRTYVLTTNEGHLTFSPQVENIVKIRISALKYTLASANNKYIHLDLEEYNSSYITDSTVGFNDAKCFCIIPVNFTINSDVTYLNSDYLSWDTSFLEPQKINFLHYRIFMNGAMLNPVEISSSNPVMLTIEFMLGKPDKNFR